LLYKVLQRKPVKPLRALCPDQVGDEGIDVVTPGQALASTCNGRASLYIGVAANPGHSSRLAESGRLVRRMSHRVDPAAIAEEART
jgi:hypothetical protein